MTKPHLFETEHILIASPARSRIPESCLSGQAQALGTFVILENFQQQISFFLMISFENLSGISILYQTYL